MPRIEMKCRRNKNSPGIKRQKTHTKPTQKKKATTQYNEHRQVFSLHSKTHAQHTQKKEEEEETEEEVKEEEEETEEK